MHQNKRIKSGIETQKQQEKSTIEQAAEGIHCYNPYRLQRINPRGFKILLIKLVV